MFAPFLKDEKDTANGRTDPQQLIHASKPADLKLPVESG